MRLEFLLENEDSGSDDDGTNGVPTGGRGGSDNSGKGIRDWQAGKGSTK